MKAIVITMTRESTSTFPSLSAEELNRKSLTFTFLKAKLQLRLNNTLKAENNGDFQGQFISLFFPRRIS